MKHKNSGQEIFLNIQFFDAMKKFKSSAEAEKQEPKAPEGSCNSSDKPNI